MSHELLEFSKQIDEQFEPDETTQDEFWQYIMSLFQ